MHFYVLYDLNNYSMVSFYRICVAGIQLTENSYCGTSIQLKRLSLAHQQYSSSNNFDRHLCEL